ncbi:MAG: MATE family efflux transporter [Eubacterium sp.]|nr:MATE family efflux transporter [Eubacterium sp.]
MGTRQHRDLILQGDLGKAIAALTIPIVINSFLQTMYNLTDTFWLGKLGTYELAAINLITPLQSIVVNIGGGITVAGSVLIARYVGAREDENARSMANQIYACAMLFALLSMALIRLFLPAIVTWLGADGETWSYSCIYMSIVILDMPFLYTINIFTSVHQAQGDTVTPMFLNFSGIVLNMILDPVLMFVMNRGVAGVAEATLLAKIFPAIIAFVLLHRKNRIVYLNLKKLRFQKEMLKSIVVIGLPTAIGGSTVQLGFLLMSRSVYAYGTDAMAAYGIGNKINSLITLPTNGIGSAVATIVGQNMGAGQVNRAEKGYLLSRKISVIFLLAGGLILSRPVIATAIVRIFSSDGEVIAMAADFLSIMALWCFANGVYNSTVGLFQGTGHTEVTTAVDITRLWIYRFVTLYVCEHWLHMGVRSVWYCVVLSNGLAAFTLYLLYKSGIWRKKRG